MKYIEITNIHKILSVINQEVNISEVITNLKQKAQSFKQGSETSSLIKTTTGYSGH